VADTLESRCRRACVAVLNFVVLVVVGRGRIRSINCAGLRHPLPPRAHNHNGFSLSSEPPLPPCVASPPPLPLSRGGGPGSSAVTARHEPPQLPPASLLDRFRPATSLGVAARDRFSEQLAVNGLVPPPGVMEPVSMSARTPALTTRTHLPGSASSSTKAHRTIKCYHCRMCEQVSGKTHDASDWTGTEKVSYRGRIARQHSRSTV